MNKLILAVPFAMALAFSTPASAQQAGLVNVDISDVMVQIAEDIDVNVDVIEDSLNDNVVQVPVGIAANVCGVDANVLAQQQQDGTAECEATSTSQALNQQVKRQVQG